MIFEPAEHETAFIKAFVVRERRARWVDLVPNPKTRSKMTESLAHANPAWFDPRCVKEIRPAQCHPIALFELLIEKGSRKRCWAISEDRQIDARDLDL